MNDTLNILLLVLSAFIVFSVVEAFVNVRARRKLTSENAVALANLEAVRVQQTQQLHESRSRVDAYQERLFAVMEEHNNLLRQILQALSSGSRGA